MLEQTIWLWNHTSHTKVYFNEFFAKVLLDNMGMIIFDLQNIISRRTLWHFNSKFGSSPQCQFCLTKIHQEIFISYDSATIQPQYLEFQNQSRRAWFLVNNNNSLGANFYFFKVVHAQFGQSLLLGFLDLGWHSHLMDTFIITRDSYCLKILWITSPSSSL